MMWGMSMAVNNPKRQGFTLIESVVSIVIIGTALITLTSFLYPQILDSARSHYEVRASALANSLMMEVLARGYDHNSDSDGGIIRCGEGGTSCTTTLGPDGINEIEDGVRKPENFNDVDDYIGCWFTNEPSKSLCTDGTVGNLTDILGANISAEYPNYVADINVEKATIDGSSEFKKVTVSVTASNYGSYTFVAHRGNY